MKQFQKYSEFVKAYPTLSDAFIPVPNSIDYDFLTEYGGSVFVVETVEDLKEVKGLPTDGETATNLYETYKLDFDIAEYFKGFALFALMNNNAGGPTYFIPKDVCDLCENIAKAIAVHEDYEN